MKKRIQIDGVWFIEEETIVQDFDITYTHQACSGIFDFMVLLTDCGAVMTDTGSVTAYIKGRDKEPQYWDNTEWLMDVRDGIKTKFENDLSDLQLAELQNLLIAATEKGWL